MQKSLSFWGYNVCAHAGSRFLCSTFSSHTHSLTHLRVPLSRQYNLLDIPALHGVHSHGGGASGGELVGTGPLQLATDELARDAVGSSTGKGGDRGARVAGRGRSGGGGRGRGRGRGGNGGGGGGGAGPVAAPRRSKRAAASVLVHGQSDDDDGGEEDDRDICSSGDVEFDDSDDD